MKASKLEQSPKQHEQSVRDLISSLTAGMQEIPTDALATTKNIVVDEEDAIYGFTSSHLNHLGPLRRTLKVTPNETNNNQCSPTKTSSPPHIYTVAKNIAASSSCISLYETIDEVDDGLPPPPGFDSPIRKAAAVAGLVGQNHQKKVSDWRTNRRSSAIILSSDFYEYDNNHQQQKHRETASRMINQSMGNILATEQLRPQQQLQPKYFIKNNQNNGGVASGQRYQWSNGRNASNGNPDSSNANVTGLAMRRSSDDLLMMAATVKERCNAKIATTATSASSILPTNRIYENLRTQMFAMIDNGSAGVIHSAGGRHTSSASSSTATASSSASTASSGHYQHHQPQHPHRFRDSRKLTKDSGYESTSTLVSLTQLNSISLASTNMTSTTSTSTVTHVVHSRSDSIDSMRSNNSSTEAGRSLSPRIDTSKPRDE